MARRTRNQPLSLNIASVNSLKRKRNEFETSIQQEQLGVVLISELHSVS